MGKREAEEKVRTLFICLVRVKELDLTNFTSLVCTRCDDET